eukprot:scaffold246334_cov19-Tisochrysis_lutea.AAC.3
MALQMGGLQGILIWVQSVTRRVFASPSYTPINLRRARADALPQPCYPDVCFVVDHEDEAFETMVGAVRCWDAQCKKSGQVWGPSFSLASAKIGE